VRVLLCALLLGLCARAAEPPVAVSDLVSRLTAALATDPDDQRTARPIGNLRLSERLSEETVGLLRQMGCGPGTVRALEALRKPSAGLPVPSEDPIATAPAPSADEQAKILAVMRRWTGAYLASLPDFVCTRTVRQFRGYRKEDWQGAGWPISLADGRWHAAGSYSGEAGYVGGRDYYRVAFRDGKPFKGTLEDLGRDLSWGEFGGLMTEILDPSREAAFAWDRWEVHGTRRMAVFRYSIDVGHARYSLRSAAAGAVTIAHRGFVYVDPRTGVIGRLILTGVGLPSYFATKAVADLLDYGEVAVGGANFVLPVKAVAYQRAPNGETREEIEYRDYRKFQSDSSVKFEH
jgi:hypothetical protein